MEEKNEWIYNYVNNLSNNINSKYGFFVIDNNTANSIIKSYTNSDEDIEQIKEIVIDDYHFSEDDSNDDHWVFIKNEKMKYIKK